MPQVIEYQDDAQSDIGECLDRLGNQGFDPQCEESVSEAAVALRQLSNNRDFLGDLLIAQLRDRHRETQDASAYGPQCIVLSSVTGGCFLRANIWPSENETCFRTSGARSFVYGVPHDHNFSFLTAGYFGPGYRSDYYEYDYEAVAGWRGEAAGLQFVERSALHEGKMMLYRAHRDVHSQLPPASLSVSLNIMHIDPAQGWMDQYGFDLDSDVVTGVLNPTSTEVFLRCAVGLGGDEAQDLAEHFGRRHPSDRMRLASYEARAMLATDEGERDALWREAEMSGSLLVAREAGKRRALLPT